MACSLFIRRILLHAAARKFQTLPVTKVAVLVDKDHFPVMPNRYDHARSFYMHVVVFPLLSGREKRDVLPVNPPRVSYLKFLPEFSPVLKRHKGGQSLGQRGAGEGLMAISRVVWMIEFVRWKYMIFPQ